MVQDQLQPAALLGGGEAAISETRERDASDAASDLPTRDWFDAQAAHRPFLALGITLAAALALIVFFVFLFVDGVR
jgi:hypothetical protein